MSNNNVANRYAVALFQLAKEQGKIEQVQLELEFVKKVFSEDKDILSTLTHPKVSTSSKKQIITEGLASLDELVRNTLLLLLDKKRIDIVIPMVSEFETLADEEQNVGRAIVYSVKPLTTDEKAKISANFAKKVGTSSLQIDNKVDRTLIGGIKVRIGDRIFDGSVKGQLDRIERTLVSGK